MTTGLHTRAGGCVSDVAQGGNREIAGPLGALFGPEVSRLQ